MITLNSLGTSSITKDRGVMLYENSGIITERQKGKVY